MSSFWSDVDVSTQAGRRGHAPALRMPRISAVAMLGILRESGVPDDEARRRVESDPALKAELDAELDTSPCTGRLASETIARH